MDVESEDSHVKYKDTTGQWSNGVHNDMITQETKSEKKKKQWLTLNSSTDGGEKLDQVRLSWSSRRHAWMMSPPQPEPASLEVSKSNQPLVAVRRLIKGGLGRN
ncbi:hypothetical protein GW17_00015433 [Ensete ventricosum]|nr:hypothetical protein GW17_00015433 [Ensete ventricosum]RZS19112.1 hypothetical protein BHM03_00051464 [Ensete ventricosum]